MFATFLTSADLNLSQGIMSCLITSVSSHNLDAAGSNALDKSPHIPGIRLYLCVCVYSCVG